MHFDHKEYNTFQQMSCRNKEVNDTGLIQASLRHGLKFRQSFKLYFQLISLQMHILLDVAVFNCNSKQSRYTLFTVCSFYKQEVMDWFQKKRVSPL